MDSQFLQIATVFVCGFLCALCSPVRVPVSDDTRLNVQLNSSEVLTADFVLHAKEIITDFTQDEIQLTEDGRTALVYKPEIVYQIPVPQQLSPSESDDVENGTVFKLSDEYVKLKTGNLTVEDFISLTGITANAGQVFKDFDLNGDGLLSKDELDRQ